MNRDPNVGVPVSHRFDALLIDEVTRVGADALEARLVVRPDTAFSDELGNLPAWAGPEIMAQAISALSGHRALARSGKPAAIGLLLGIRGYTSPRGDFRRGEELRISVTESSEEDGWAVFDCTICRAGGELLASGRLTVLQPPDDTFLDAECARED